MTRVMRSTTRTHPILMGELMKRALAVAVVTAALAGCGGGADTSAQAPTPTPSPSRSLSPTEAFQAEIAESGFGTKDTSDPGFLGAGNVTCQGFSDGVGYGQQVQALEEGNARPSRAQAENFIKAAVRHLCPEHEAMVPGGVG